MGSRKVQAAYLGGSEGGKRLQLFAEVVFLCEVKVGDVVYPGEKSCQEFAFGMK